MNIKEIEPLYRKLFEAEAFGDNELAQSIRNRIDRILRGEPTIAESFFKEMKDKKFFKTLKEFLENDIDDLKVALMLSSYVTHSLIEMDRKGKESFEELKISEISRLLSRFLEGEVDVFTVRDTIKQEIGPYL